MTCRRAPLRGCSWNNGSNSGLGALNLNNAPSNRNSNVGFRPALILRQKPMLYAALVSAILNGLHTLSHWLEYGWQLLVSSRNVKREGLQYA